MRRAALLAAACAIAAAVARPAAAASGVLSGPEDAELHLAIFRRTHFELSLPILDPFERLLREEGRRYALEGVETVASQFNGEDYLLRLPERPAGEAPPPAADEAAPVEEEVEVLETAGGYFTVYPPHTGLMDRFMFLARDRESYRDRRAASVRRRSALMTRTRQADGGELASLRLNPAAAVRYSQWRATVAAAYRLRIEGRTHEAVFLYRTLGGEGRLASALRKLEESFGPNLLVLNRGEIFVTGVAKTTGTAAGHRFTEMGVRAAAVGAGELYRFSDLLGYRAESPGGVRFLSANLVYATDTARTPLPAYAVFPVGRLRVGVLGLTRPDWGRFLRGEHARTLAVVDPLAPARAAVEALRGRADVVVALSNLEEQQNAALQRELPGIDLVAGDTFPFDTDTKLSASSAGDPERGPDDLALLVTGDWPTVLTHVALDYHPGQGERYALYAKQEHIILDESWLDLEGYPKFDPAEYGVEAATGPPLLPSARRLYGGARPAQGLPRLEPDDFWSLAASLLADRLGAELVFLPAFPIEERTAGDYREPLVRDWLRWAGDLSVFELPGEAAQALLAEARRQRAGGAAPVGGLRLAAGGSSRDGRVHGEPVDGRAVYRVAATEELFARPGQFPGLAQARNARSAGPAPELVLAELRRRAAEGWPVERYRALLDGSPVSSRGLWKVNFRDISLNLSNTKVVSDPAFASVPNSRVRGFDELLIGAASKLDLEYFRGDFKWTNAGELEYSRSRVRPPGQPVILNTPRNRSLFRTLGSYKLGAFPVKPIANSFGPSLGFEYEGHVERLPLTRRRHVVSLLPGAELYGGTVLNSVELSGNLRRDFTPQTPVNQFGFRARVVVSRALGPGRLQGETRGDYFFRRRQDTAQDLLLEWNTNLKLHVPLRGGSFTIAPFFDIDYFVLKIRPLSGYSAITGISLGFSRLWKPQYESL